MIDHIWLHWFPIALGVGIACGLAGPRRSRLITIAGAAYWLSLAISLTQGGILREVASFWSALGGAAVIGLIGMWVAPPSMATPAPAAVTSTKSSLTKAPGSPPAGAAADLVAQFDVWLADNRSKPDPWPYFGEFVVSAIQTAVGGKHVRVYRLMSDDDQLHPLRNVELGEADFPSSRTGIVGHVATTGRSFYAGDPAQGELVQKLAAEHDPCAWCFAVRKEQRTIGMVRVGELEARRGLSVDLLKLIEGVVTLCWITLAETCRGRLAGHVDPISGVLTQSAFMKTAVRSLQDSYSHGEPVAVVNINIEGMRRLHDHGEWDQANALIHEVSSLLMQRIRQDDEIGVFDSSRFLILLRRVDSELATLIVTQLMEKLKGICADQRRWGGELTARCGVAGSGTHQPSLHALVTRATDNSHKAREKSVQIVSDLCQPVRSKEAIVA